MSSTSEPSAEPSLSEASAPPAETSLGESSPQSDLSETIAPTLPRILFAGPSLRGLATAALDATRSFRLCSPVRRGDIQALLSEPPGLLVIVDGLFHDCLAVGHVEIRDAIERGWQVWGLASMGAIRAYEMRFLGMRGWGRVYQRFDDEEDFQDDEVALLHAPPPDYTPISEPLVHLRVALEDWMTRGLLTPDAAAAIVHDLKSRWYGDRTLDRFFRLVANHGGAAIVSQIPFLRADFEPYRWKSRDLEAFLIKRVWENSDHP